MRKEMEKKVTKARRMEGTLYLVPTPIGNLGDMTHRAVETLQRVDLIACEDTRNSIKLLNQYDIKNKLISYHKFNERKQCQALIKHLLSGKDLAVITDAGTPAISDPASILVKEAIANRIEVCCLPGATACITALAASGLNTDRFTFIGFLPTRKKDRILLLKSLMTLNQTLIFYESTHSILATLVELETYFPERECVLAREISKLHETYTRGKLSLLAHQPDMETRGEFVILIEGNTSTGMSEEELTVLINAADISSQSLAELTAFFAEKTGHSRNKIKQLILARKNRNPRIVEQDADPAQT
jgi:16S rRNA (cytidine1402-2'-O)-methyltransferase